MNTYRIYDYLLGGVEEAEGEVACLVAGFADPALLSAVGQGHGGERAGTRHETASLIWS